MATPKIIADFESSLATAIAIGATAFTLSSATDDDGVALPTGLYYFTVDNGSSNKEYLAGTLTGTSVTGVVSVSRQGVETSGAVRAHRVGASVILTDFATYFNYMNQVALVSAPDASTSVKGVVETATLAEVRARTGTGGTGAKLVATPDVLDDLPTSAQKDALAAGGNFGTVSSSNKYITETYNASATGLPVVRTYLTAASPATWTKPAGLKYIIVEAQAAGGGGAGYDTDGTDGPATSGSGGGYCKKLIPASSLGATETVTIAAAGTGGSSATTATSGTNAGNTTFGSHVTAGGGVGATANSATIPAGGTATGGDVNIPGGTGSGLGTSGAQLEISKGGDSFLGFGSTVNLNGGTVVGGTGYGYGGGGGTDSGPTNGQAGGPALVIVTEYYS